MRNSRIPLAVALALSVTGMAASAQTTAPNTAPAPITTSPTTPQNKDLTGDLAKASLAKQGITNPTRAQLAAERKAIADQRAKGMGWGQIAQSLGLNLGQVVSASNHARHEDRKESHQGKEHKEHMKHSTTTAHGDDRGGAGKSSGGEHGGSHTGNGGGSHSGGGKGK